MRFSQYIAAISIWRVHACPGGDRFSGSLLLAGNAAFALMWGVGGLIGPPTVGAAMNFFDPEGFPITLGLSYAMLTALIVTNMIRTKRAG